MHLDRGIKVGKVAGARLSPKSSRGICPSRKTIGEAMTYTIHCSKKLLDRVKPLLNVEHNAPTTYLGNWYATTLFWKPQVALLVNELTLLPVLMPLAPAAELAKRFTNHPASTLFASGTPDALPKLDLTSSPVDQCIAKSIEDRNLRG